MTKHKQTLLDNPEIMYEDPARAEVLQELDRLGIENDPYPEDGKCPKCGAELKSYSGMVGEEVIYCSNKECDYGWEDAEGAISAVY